MMLAAEWGIARALSMIVRRSGLFYMHGKINYGVGKTRKPTIFVREIQVAVESSIMVEAGIVAALFGCEDSIVNFSVLQQEKN